MILTAALISGFLIGSIPFGLLISRFWLGIDIRQKGSGNIGMTNVMRVGGRWPGLLTFLLDFAKGCIPVLLFRGWTFHSGDYPLLQEFLSALVGASAVCGHIFPVFLRFQGGKGVSTLFGVLVAVYFPIGLLAALTWGGMFLWKRISSLSALTMLLLLPGLFVVIPWVLEGAVNWPRFFVIFALSLLLIFKHHDNIRRLLSGQEGQLRSKQGNKTKLNQT